MDVIEEIAAERRRQVTDEGFTVEADDKYIGGELAAAAACYALHDMCGGFFGRWIPSIWPWKPEWLKPTTRRRNLVKAGALILAEIERLDRWEARDIAFCRDRFAGKDNVQ
jgi:hypothetical protein